MLLRRQANNEAKRPVVPASNRRRAELHEQAGQQVARRQRTYRGQLEPDEEDEEALLEDRWRQAARLISDEDELRLFGDGALLDKARNGTPEGRIGSPQTRNNTEEPDGDDDNSSISFAQSGCHSILSAWRIKAANRAARRSRRPISVLSNGSSTGKRSQAASTVFTARSSIGTGVGQLLRLASGKSAAAQSRILLGPTSAQHFVTNSKRRRRANELVLTTLDAHRRAAALNRQNASLLGSASYLAEPGAHSPASDQAPLDDTNYRLLRSPSPLGMQSSARPGFDRNTPSPKLATKASLSDLGAISGRSAAEAQRNRLVLMSAKQLRNSLKGEDQRASNTKAAHKQAGSNNPRNPPLARLDQNSSDLNTTNSSSSGSESSVSSSSGSQFTQLVTSELVAPDCALLEQHQAAAISHLRPLSCSMNPDSRTRSSPSPLTQLATGRNQRRPLARLSSPEKETPKAMERNRRKQKGSANEKSSSKTPSKSSFSPVNLDRNPTPDRQQTASGLDRPGKLRRGALRRDSIRRLRLNRSSSTGSQVDCNEESSSEVAAPPSGSTWPKEQTESHETKLQALSRARKLDIENNPFLNRHHFRTTSVRSNATGGIGSGRPQSPTPLAKRPSQVGGSLREPPSSRATKLFGLASRNNHTDRPTNERETANRVEREPRMFSEARRVGSMEQVAGSGGGGGGVKSGRQEQAEGIKQVERMLRAMQPNQVFSSYCAKEESERSVSKMSGSLIGEPQRLRNSESHFVDGNNARERDFRQAKAPQQSDSHGNRQVPMASRLNRMQLSREAKQGTVPSATKLASQQLASSNFDWQNNDNKSSYKPAATELQQPVVREGSRFKDDLKFDGMGNRRQFELTERWKHEQSTSPSGGDEERFVSKRMELVRSSSISPPQAFADNNDKSSAPIRQQRGNEHQQQVVKLVGSDRIAPPRGQPIGNQHDSHGERQQQRLPAPRHDTRYLAGAGQTPTGRSLSEERPVVAARRRAAPTGSVAKDREAQSGNQTLTNAGNQRHVSAVNLPKFESTAEDEFKKRVDYLRKLARANLTGENSLAKSHRGNQETAAKTQQQAAINQRAPATTTKPMSTNWWQPAESLKDTSELSQPVSSMANDGSARWNLSADSPSSQTKLQVKQAPASNRSPATTNLDLALLADRYQTSGSNPLDASLSSAKWRRSNSSLASVGTRRSDATGAMKKPLTRAESPSLLAPVPNEKRKVASIEQQQQQQISQRTLKAAEPQRPIELTSSAVVKLVVKEKSAPELDHAFVEQQPVVQQVRQLNSAQTPPFTLANRGQTASANARQPILVEPSYPAPKLLNPIKQQVLASSSPRQTNVRSPLRVASPRSPEFGNLATSSNDDSAIASSVSSPSLSFMLNTANSGDQSVNRAASQVATGGRGASPSSLGQQRNLVHLQQQQPSSISRPQRLADSSSSGALQSILRRHQQQQYQIHSTGDSSDSSANQTATGESNQPQASEQVSARFVAKQQVGRPQEPLFRSDARSPELQAAEELDSSLEHQSNQRRSHQPDNSSPPKRVHFNDRTSIRSFESISSLASNSTAVPNSNALLVRQQLGSPDSLGSGSTSRLSTESPDLRRTTGLGSGAAIYAVRGDPELELAPERAFRQQQQQQQYVMTGQQPTSANVGQPAYLGAPALRQTPIGGPMVYAPIARYDLGGQAQFIRMTAPPSISTSSLSPRQPIPLQTGNVQYIVRPTSATSTRIVPAMAPRGVFQGSSHLATAQPIQHDDDDEEPDYALRLRQAATNRVFTYADGGMQTSPAQRHLSPASHHQVLSQQQQQHSNRSRLAMEDLLNFQTEV